MLRADVDPSLEETIFKFHDYVFSATVTIKVLISAALSPATHVVGELWSWAKEQKK